MTISGIFKRGFTITTKASVAEFYKCIKSVNLIPYDNESVIRVEPDAHFSIVSKKAISDGTAPFVPAFKDDDGSMAYKYRKYINTWLRNM